MIFKPYDRNIAHKYFLIIEEPSIADPAWQIPCVDFTGDKPIQYSNFEVLKNLIHKLELKTAENIGYGKGVDYVLSQLGLSFEQFHEKALKYSEENKIESGRCIK